MSATGIRVQQLTEKQHLLKIITSIKLKDGFGEIYFIIIIYIITNKSTSQIQSKIQQ